MIKYVEDKILEYCKELDKRCSDISILLSFSGGIDSIVLASILIELKKKNNFKLILIHFNHNIQKQSKSMEKFCIKYAKNNSIKCIVKQLFFDNKHNFEAVSRIKRYKILKSQADKLFCDYILTAHHKNDQIETIFMKKIDGADWISRVGIRTSLGKIRRPLINVPKVNIKNYAKINKIIFFEDPTNNDMSIKRNMVRRRLLPEAIKQNKHLEEILFNESILNKNKMLTIFSFFDKNKYKLIIDKTISNIKINLNNILSFKVEELKLFLYWIFKDNQNVHIPSYSRSYWIELKKYITESSSGSKFYIGNWVLFINRNRMIIDIISPDLLKEPNRRKISVNNFWYRKRFIISNVNLYKESKDKNFLIISNYKLKQGLYLRRWKYGDKISTYKERHNSLISNIFIDHKFSQLEKLIHPIVVDIKDRIIWVPGIAFSGIKPNSKTNDLKIIKCLAL